MSSLTCDQSSRVNGAGSASIHAVAKRFKARRARSWAGTRTDWEDRAGVIGYASGASVSGAAGAIVCSPLAASGVRMLPLVGDPVISVHSMQGV